MKKLIGSLYFKILIFLIIVFILDHLFGRILEHFYSTQESGYLFQTTYVLEKTTAEVLVFGSSRAYHHYYPAAFKEGLNMSFYNCGKDGTYIFYHYAVLESILKRYKPKIIIYDFTLGEFANNTVSYDQLSSLLPYYEAHLELRPIIELKSKYEKYKFISKVYPYNSCILSIILSKLDFNKSKKEDDDGYAPLIGEGNLKIGKPQNAEEYEIDTVKIQYFERFIRVCQKNRITVFFVISPYFKRLKTMDASIKIGIEIMKRYGVKYFDYLQDERFLSTPAYFNDFLHMNDSGARLFSKIVVENIKKELK